MSNGLVTSAQPVFRTVTSALRLAWPSTEQPIDATAPEISRSGNVDVNGSDRPLFVPSHSQTVFPGSTIAVNVQEQDVQSVHVPATAKSTAVDPAAARPATASSENDRQPSVSSRRANGPESPQPSFSTVTRTTPEMPSKVQVNWLKSMSAIVRSGNAIGNVPAQRSLFVPSHSQTASLSSTSIRIEI